MIGAVDILSENIRIRRDRDVLVQYLVDRGHLDFHPGWENCKICKVLLSISDGDREDSSIDALTMVLNLIDTRPDLAKRVLRGMVE